MSHGDRSSELVLEHVVSEGSFGRIYRARYKATSSIVAVKVVTDSDEVRNEINFLSKCNCPFTVGYFGSFLSGPNMWVVTDYCGGGYVSDLMKGARSDYTMPENCIRAVCAGIVSALEYLHTVGVCHRDIRCGNILLTNAGYVKLTGFGLSAEVDDVTKKCKSLVVGSHSNSFWIAPEVIQGAHHDCKADVWSLGITTIELAEGAPPHSNLNPLQAIPIISPKPMMDFIDCCCQKDPSERSDSKSLMSHSFVKEEVTRDWMGSPLFPWHLFSKDSDS